MRFNLLLILALSIGTLLSGCGGDSGNTTNVSTTANTANTNSTQPAANSGLDTTKKPEAETSNNAPTLTPVVRTYYEALQKKDDALLKTVMSQEFIKSVETDMKEEKRTGIAVFMAEFEKIPEKPVEVRNERIQGTDAVAELKGGTYLTWTPFAFKNEGGKWKFTGGSPVLK